MPRRRSTRLRRTLRLNARNSPGDATVLKWNMIALRDIGFRADVAGIMYDSSRIAHYVILYLSLFPCPSPSLVMFLVRTLFATLFIAASRSKHLACRDRDSRSEGSVQFAVFSQIQSFVHHRLRSVCGFFRHIRAVLSIEVFQSPTISRISSSDIVSGSRCSQSP